MDGTVHDPPAEATKETDRSNFTPNQSSRLSLRQKASFAVLVMTGLSLSSFTYFSATFSQLGAFNLGPLHDIHVTLVSGNKCKIVIGVFSKLEDSYKRDVVRQTWGRNIFSSNLTTIKFVVGSPIVEIPHARFQLEREMAVCKDIILLNISDANSEYSKSVEWFSWAAEMTTCDLIFRTRDDSYVRVQPMLRFLKTSLGANPKKKCFGVESDRMLGADNFYMSSTGYGISRDVAMWIAKNRNSFHVSNQSEEDLALGNLLFILRSISGLDYVKDSAAFGPNCTQQTILDSPAFSHGFNMYVRYHDEIRGDFCAHFEKIVVSSVLEHKKGIDGFFNFEPVIFSQLNVLDDTVAPWNRSNRWRYTQDRDRFHTRLAYTFKSWLALKPMGVFGGEDIFTKFISSEQSLYSVAVNRAKIVAERLTTCHTKKIVGTWLKTWGDRREYLVHMQCREKINVDKAILIHIPFRPDGHIEIYSPAYIVGTNRIAVIVPVTCRLERLQSFLNTSGAELRKIGGRERKIILTWSFCKEEESKFSESDIKAVAERFQRSLYPDRIEVQLVFFEDGVTFSRSRALNRAFRACEATDIAVVLDVDVYVNSEFYLNCLAFARPGHSMYFPIMFSRYNPKYIEMYADAGASNFGSMAFLGKPTSITPDTGIWREFSLGMVALCVQDAESIGYYDDKIQGWGVEDVEFFERAYEAGFMNWRMYEPNEVHLYHSKDCSGLIADRIRYRMCLSAKLRMEGNQLQLAYALHHQEQQSNPIQLQGNSMRKKTSMPLRVSST